MTETAQAGPTVQTFLLGGGPEDDSGKIGRLLSQHDLLGAVGGDLSRLTRQGHEAAAEGLASATTGLLDIDVGDVLVYGWRTHEQLIAAARRTARVAGRQEVVQLGSHQISSTLRPTIDLRPGRPADRAQGRQLHADLHAYPAASARRRRAH